MESVRKVPPVVQMQMAQKRIAAKNLKSNVLFISLPPGRLFYFVSAFFEVGILNEKPNAM